LGVVDLIAAYTAGLTDPPAVVAALTRRIAERGGRTGAVLRIVESATRDAQESAARYRAGTARPLDGVPFGVKDIIDVSGVPVTAGSLHTGDRVAVADATVVARLRAAGAIPLCMLATTEFACGGPVNPRYGAVTNPWRPERWTGGSSSGSAAALADRLVPFALGSDTGGSIRVPSAWCGVTGLKPTYGLVPRTGVVTLSWTLDHVGPMARSAADLALVLAVVAGQDGVDPTAFPAPASLPAACADVASGTGPASLDGVRIGLPTGWFTDAIDPAVLHAWRDAAEVLRAAGAEVVPVAVPVEDVRLAHEEGWVLLQCELAAGQESGMAEPGRYDPVLLERIKAGGVPSAPDYLRMVRRRAAVQRLLAAVFDGAATSAARTGNATANPAAGAGAGAGVDVLLTPAVGAAAPVRDEMELEIGGERWPARAVQSRNVMIFNYVGFPALALPAGRDRVGLPLAVQVAAPPFRDATCLRVGRAFQDRTDHHRATPPE
jgi:aspartyl-tRNA(Asn)/glutamyl-tRNA(Gln) amidotransferase subunit A